MIHNDESIGKFACPACANVGRRAWMRHGGATYWRCRNCGTVSSDATSNPVDFQERVIEAYSINSESIRAQALRRIELQQTAEVVLSYQASGKLLDLGCGAGHFLHYFSPDRWRRYIVDALIETTISRDILLLIRVDKPALLRRLFR